MSSALNSCLQLIRPVIKNSQAYHVADASGLIKLDAMENPYTLSVDVKKELQERLKQAELNRYPDPSAVRLRDKIAQVMKVPEERSIVLGNGSDELIQMLVMAVSEQNGTRPCILSFEPGFVMYRIISEFVGVDYVGVPLDEDFQIDLPVAMEAIARSRPAIIFIAYPNNPSANCYSREDIEEIISSAPGMVVLDEAYHPFAQDSFMSRLADYDNLLVMRTVSKMGLAGLRLGLLCGHPDLIHEIDKIRLPYNINVLTQVAAETVLDNIDVLDEQAASIRAERERLLAAMGSVSGLQVYPSDANFILFRVLGKAATDVFDSIKQSGILIKNMKADRGLLKNCLRVTVGEPSENLAFLEALLKAVND